VSQLDLLRQYLERRRSPSTVRHYASETELLMNFAKKESGFDRNDLTRYFNYLIDKGYAHSTLVWKYSVLKRTFKIMGESFHMDMDDLPPQTDEKELIIMPAGAIRDMIRITARNGRAAEKFYLLMSTLYGLRRIELSRLTWDSFGPNYSTVTIDTAKRGVRRTHIIPEDIRCILEDVRCAMESGPRDIPYSTDVVGHILFDICGRAHYELRSREGWHAIRHALVTALIDASLPVYLVHSFMRWKSLENRGDPYRIAAVYYRPDSASVDTAVFSQHPFLGSWTIHTAP